MFFLKTHFILFYQYKKYIINYNLFLFKLEVILFLSFFMILD